MAAAIVVVVDGGVPKYRKDSKRRGKKQKDPERRKKTRKDAKTQKISKKTP